MANWCSNIVGITYKDENLKQEFIDTVMGLEIEQSKEPMGKLPYDNSKSDDLWWFDISLENEYETLFFSTKWVPGIDSLYTAAKKYHFNFEVEYEESGDMIYGIVKYDYDKDELLLKNVPDSVYESAVREAGECSIYDDLDEYLEGEAKWSSIDYKHFRL